MPGSTTAADTPTETHAGTPAAGSDARIVALARGGDARAWNALVERHQPLLSWIARHHGLDPHDTADLTQTVWMTCVEKLSQLTDDAAFTGWLVTIARRQCWLMVSRNRRCRPTEVEALSALAPSREDVVADVLRREELSQLRAAIADLPERQQAVLHVLIGPAEVDYATAALRLGVPIGSLGPTRRRAVARLRTDPRLALAG